MCPPPRIIGKIKENVALVIGKNKKNLDTALEESNV